MELYELLSALCAAPGVSGAEAPAAETARFLLQPLGDCRVTPLGSLLCRLPAKKEGLPRVMLTAHLDQIGLMVTRVTEKGFLKAAPCGGLDGRSLAGARVTVQTASGPLPGVVCAVPPHLADGKKTLPKADESAVDVGLSGERAAELVRCGDRVTLDGPLTRLLADRVCGASLDDRAGCAAVIRAAELLRDRGGAELVVALVTQEEINSSGAATAAFSTAPDCAVAVDVTVGLAPDERPEQCGVMGGGPMVGFAPILDRRLSKRFVELAGREGIPCQYEVMTGKTGTDCDAIAPARAGIPTALISIPLRFMHTPSEVASLSDIENAARLIAAGVGGGLCAN